MDPKTPQNYAFISVDGEGKPKPSARKLIRSHCMNGRNLRIGRDPVPEYTAWKAGRPAVAKQDDELQDTSIPPSPPSDLALFRFAGEVDDHSRMLIYNVSTQVGRQELCMSLYRWKGHEQRPL